MNLRKAYERKATPARTERPKSASRKRPRVQNDSVAYGFIMKLILVSFRYLHSYKDHNTIEREVLKFLLAPYKVSKRKRYRYLFNPCILLFTKLPKRNRTCRRYIQAIDPRTHGNAHRIIAARNRMARQPIALGAEHERKLVDLRQLGRAKRK